MSDSIPSLDPKRVYFVVDRDVKWKKMTVDSFISSTSDDLLGDDDLSHIFLEPEKISIGHLMKEWLKEPSDHGKWCEICETGLCSLRKTVGAKKVPEHKKCAK